MKRNLIALAIAALTLLPLTAVADHLRGSFVSFGGGHVVISTGDHHHRRFAHHRRVNIVDDHGNVLDHHALRRHHPVTVHYSHHRGHDRVSRIVVHRRSHRDH